MNNAQVFLYTHLKGLSITFKPIEKGKDRPVQTMTFNEFHIGQFGLEVETSIAYKTKNSDKVTTATRLLSIARVMEYVAQAAQQTYEDAVVETVATEVATDEAPEEVLESVKEERVVDETLPVISLKRNKKGKVVEEVEA